MTVTSIGDMRQFFQSNRANVVTKTALNTLVQELTTGQVADLNAHLGMGQSTLASYDRQLKMLGQFSQGNTETAQMLSVMQSSLGSIEQQRLEVGTALFTVNDASPPSHVDNVAEIAVSGFETTVTALNTRFAGRALFGGNQIASAPLASADVMLDALRIKISGSNNTADFKAAIDTWFDAPDGGFATIGYLGDANGQMTRSIGPDQTLDIDLRADDPAIRGTLKTFALAALANDPSSSLNIEDQRSLQQQAAGDLFSIAAPIAALQGRIGYAQGQLESASVNISSRETSFSIARTDLVSADPFETATRLQAVQVQLETQYALTARLSRLSLTEYLR